MLPRIFALSLLALLTLGACAESSPSGPAAENEVRVGNNFFSPTSRTVGVGTTITWRWNGGASTHNVTFADGPASANKSSGTYTREFTVAGTYAYTCTIHGAGMSGSVTVN